MAQSTEEPTINPHGNDPDEDHGQHSGGVIPDPWDDESQGDWSNITSGEG